MRSLDEHVRQVVREELAALLEEPRKDGVRIDDIARQRARAALRRLGVALPDAVPAKGAKR